MTVMQHFRENLSAMAWPATHRRLVRPLFWVPPVLLSAAVIGADAYNFLIGHITAELFTVAIAWVFFAMGWKTNLLGGNRLLIAMGCGFFWVGAVDLVHLMAYKDMNLLPIGGANGASSAWIAGRIVQVATFLIAPLLVRVGPKLWVQWLIFGVIATALTTPIFTGDFPVTYIDGVGQSPLKIAAEYVLMALLAVAMAMIVLLPEDMLPKTHRPVVLYSLFVTILSELLFTRYIDVFSFTNTSGHIMKVWAFWLLFDLSVQINLTDPFLTLKRLSQVIEQAPAMVIITDRNGIVEYVNPQFEIDTGYTAPEIIGKHVDILQSAEMPAQILDTMWKTIGRGEMWRGYFRNVRKDGSLYWDKSSISPIRDERGRILSYVAIKEDVTQKRQVEEFLLDSENATTKMLTGAIEAMVELLESRDPYTGGHSRKVGAIAQIIAHEMGLPSVQMEGLRLAAMIHDIGKIKVPMDILNKPGKLTPNEFELIKEHPRTAYETIKGIPFPWDVPAIVLAHHERWDGSGYPNGWAGEKIPLEAQILSVADVLDAISSHRPYREKLGTARAFEEIEKGRGTSFSPAVVAAALRARQRIEALQAEHAEQRAVPGTSGPGTSGSGASVPGAGSE